MTMKQFRLSECERCGVHQNTVIRRMQDGTYKDSIAITRTNARIVFVFETGPLPQSLKKKMKTGMSPKLLGVREYKRRYMQRRRKVMA